LKKRGLLWLSGTFFLRILKQMEFLWI
jgi:hypothetical protein